MTNGIKEYSEGNPQDSIQFRSDGEPAVAAYELGAIPIRIYSDAQELPAWWSPARDMFLRQTLHSNSLISGVVYGEVTRVKNMPYQLVDETDDETGDVDTWQDMLTSADFGNGFRVLLSKVALDLLTQDNGAFIELIGEGDVEQVTRDFEGSNQKITFTAKPERKGKVKSLAYLDASCCWRTYDPEYPVIYTNPYTGVMTVLHWTRIIKLSQFEQGYELGRGVGLCALSRTYEMARMVLAMNTYYYEKITGQSPEIYFTNTPTKKLEDSIAAATLNNFNKGFNVFKDSVIVSPKSGGAGQPEFKIDKLGLRDAPDGFDYDKQLTLSVYIIANAFGVDAREIWPATMSGATRADAEVQHSKSAGKGRGDIMQMLEDALNWRVFPPEVTFKFDVIDDLEDELKAKNAKLRAETRQIQIMSGELTIYEARQMAAEWGDIDPSFLEDQLIADDDTDATGVDQQGETIVETPDTETPEESEKEASHSGSVKKNYIPIPEASFSQKSSIYVN